MDHGKRVKVSDQFLLSDGSCGIIETIEVETLSTPETTYNFEVEDFHTYYVSTGGVVHNRGCNKLKPDLRQRERILHAGETLKQEK